MRRDLDCWPSPADLAADAECSRMFRERVRATYYGYEQICTGPAATGDAHRGDSRDCRAHPSQSSTPAPVSPHAATLSGAGTSCTSIAKENADD